MDTLFYPNSIAIIGASRYKWKVGHIIFKNALKSKVKKVFPVNPNASYILGKKAFSSVLDIKENVDLAVIAVRNNIVPYVLKECGEKGVDTCIIISAGFSEIGNYDLENKIVKLAKKYNMRLLGPNSFGIWNAELNLNLTFYPYTPYKGKCSLISQSGGLAVGMFDYFYGAQIGINKFVSIGNEADITISETINYLKNDKTTKAIFLYVEGVKEGKLFLNVLKGTGKPIFIFKGGKTQASLYAVKSHTASLAGDYKIFKDLVTIRGSYIVEDFDIFLDLFYIQNVLYRRKIGKNTIIITNTGGLGIILSDTLTRIGFNIIKLPKDIIFELSNNLPQGWSRNNPIDIVGDAGPERLETTLKTLLDKNFKDIYENIFLILTPQNKELVNKLPIILREIRKDLEKSKKTIFLILFGFQSFKPIIKKIRNISKNIIYLPKISSTYALRWMIK